LTRTSRIAPGFGLFAILGAFVAGFAGDLGAQPQKNTAMNSHLTIYVPPSIVASGGTVLVASIEVPVEEWEKLKDGDNPARDDRANAKKSVLTGNDRLFGVTLDSNASVIELKYPAGGTSGFNLVPTEGPDEALNTERLLVGSGGYVLWASGKEQKWETVSTVHIAGTEASERRSRAIRMGSSKLMNKSPARRDYEGATLYSFTAAQVSEVADVQYE
jgi:hypothetical protein